MADGQNKGVFAKVQLAVDVASQKCVLDIQNRLNEFKDDIKSVQVDFLKQTVIVESSLPSHEIVNLIESTGKHKAIITGIGNDSSQNQSNLGSAVAIMHEGNPTSGIRGVTRIVQTSMDDCLVDGTLDGLEPNTSYKLGVHEYGDLSAGCQSCGDVMQTAPGATVIGNKAYGDLGCILSDRSGRASFRVVNDRIKTWDVIGRSMVLSKLSETNNRVKLSCGVIARSAGLFENAKRICACDGVTIWDERNVPIAGHSRRPNTNSQL